MNNLFNIIVLSLIALILIWRFWSKTGGVFIVLAVIFLAYRYSSVARIPILTPKAQSTKEDIIAFSKTTIDSVAGVMHSRKYVEKPEGNVLIYQKEAGKDFYKFFLAFPGKFVIAFGDDKEYYGFFESIDSLKIQQSAIGCNNGNVYQLTEECYVCKTGFKRVDNKFILSVSRSLNFSTIVSPKRKPLRKKPKPEPKPEPKPKGPIEIEIG